MRERQELHANSAKSRMGDRRGPVIDGYLTDADGRTDVFPVCPPAMPAQRGTLSNGFKLMSCKAKRWAKSMTPDCVLIKADTPLIEAYFAPPCTPLGITKKRERKKLMPRGRFPPYKKEAVRRLVHAANEVCDLSLSSSFPLSSSFLLLLRRSERRLFCEDGCARHCIASFVGAE